MILDNSTQSNSFLHESLQTELHIIEVAAYYKIDLVPEGKLWFGKHSKVSSAFAIDPQTNLWYCTHHKVEGGDVSTFIAVAANLVKCEEAHLGLSEELLQQVSEIATTIPRIVLKHQQKEKVEQEPIRLLKTPDGYPKHVLANVEEILMKDSVWEEVLAFNSFEQAVKVLKAPPYVDKASFDAHTLTDQDIRETVVWLERRYRLNCNKTMVEDGLELVGGRHTYHPVQAYLRGLQWDGTPRIDAWLVRYAQTEDSPYIRAIAPKILLSAVARVMEPGCKVDTMPILVGAQGLGKSTLWMILAGEMWFSDSLADLHNKDAMQDLQGKWFVEMADLATWKRSEYVTIKQFVSKQMDRFRPPYGRRSQDFKRQSVFVGTTNNYEIFKDDTGNRRFWPIEVGGTCAIEALQRDRDQLWAEALTRYLQREQWYLSSEEEPLAAAQQHLHLETDEWEPDVLEYIDRQNTDRLTVKEIMEYMGLGLMEQTPMNAKRIGSILRRNGWIYTPFRKEGVKDKLFKGFMLKSGKVVK